VSDTRAVGLLHPGAMGASVGAALRRAGVDVLYASEGRSDASRARATAADLRDAVTVAALARESNVIVSLCPPGAARDVARTVADAQFAGVYVDANAIAPSTARAVATIVAAHGATYVDGSVIGAPVQPYGWTRLYLSGAGADSIAAQFEPDDPTVVVLGDDPTAASTLKMCNAAWTKATSAALLTIWGTAQSAGVWEALQAEWGRGHADLLTRIEQITVSTPARAWRFAGEMEEIAQTFEDAHLPGGFGIAAAEVYERLARFKDDPHPEPAAVLAALLDPPAPAR
jgi:3-hydroxyisobutyrate dehydrogenase-like beta-hydroxyacid dehydrogenase